jgi:hypothetical protein
MTKTWGPLGWATLHSVAALYPDDPSESEKMLLIRWIESFRRCIVCDKCKTHFTTLIGEYFRMHPDWNSSRKNLTLFVMRAHNTVNVRQLSRPALSLEESIAALKTNIPESKAAAMRQSYIVHIRHEWNRSLNLDGVTAARYIRELILVETDYWSNRHFEWDDVEALVQGESINPLPSSEPKRIGNVVISQKPARLTFSIPSAKPKFSFLSR